MVKYTITIGTQDIYGSLKWRQNLYTYRFDYEILEIAKEITKILRRVEKAIL